MSESLTSSLGDAELLTGIQWLPWVTTASKAAARNNVLCRRKLQLVVRNLSICIYDRATAL